MIPLVTDLIDTYKRSVTEDPNTGNDVETYNLLDSQLPASVQPVSSTENLTLQNTYRNQTSDYFEVYISGRSELNAQDRIEANGLTLEIDGNPKYWNILDHTVFNARIVRG